MPMIPTLSLQSALRLTALALFLGLAPSLPAAAQNQMEPSPGWCCATLGEGCFLSDDAACAEKIHFSYGDDGDANRDCEEHCVDENLCGNNVPDPGECGPNGTCLEDDCPQYRECDEYESSDECVKAAGCDWYDAVPDYSDDNPGCKAELNYCGDSQCQSQMGSKTTEDDNSCPLDCSIQCGNNIQEGEEECDEGDQVDGDGCDASCRIEECGNNRVDRYEYCDPGTGTAEDGFANFASEDCNIYCDWSWCGDGIIDEGYDYTSEQAFAESCDDGNNDNGDGCAQDCTLEGCGNGIEDTIGTDPYGDDIYESCDDGNLTSGDGCSEYCESEWCGNGETDAGEECDQWYEDEGGRLVVDTEICDVDCTFAGCGDGYTNTAANERCDDGNLTSGDGCSDTCMLESCGDWTINSTLGLDGKPLEECDDGNDENDDGCSATCKNEACGDGIAQEREECDPYEGYGTTGTTDDIFQADAAGPGCSQNCTWTYCGDGEVDDVYDGEVCDSGQGGTDWPMFDADDSADCNFDCTEAFCGDGYTNEAAGEQCDDGYRCESGASCTLNDEEGCADGSSCEKRFGFGCDQDCQDEAAARGACCFDYDYDASTYLYQTSGDYTQEECVQNDGRWADIEDQTEDLDQNALDYYCSYKGGCCNDSGSVPLEAYAYDCDGTYLRRLEVDIGADAINEVDVPYADGELRQLELNYACNVKIEFVCLESGGGTERRTDDGEVSMEMDQYVANNTLYVTNDQNDPNCIDVVWLDDGMPESFAQAVIDGGVFYTSERAFDVYSDLIDP